MASFLHEYCSGVMRDISSSAKCIRGSFSRQHIYLDPLSSSRRKLFFFNTLWYERDMLAINSVSRDRSRKHPVVFVDHRLQCDCTKRQLIE